jgi:hypothetical protein
VLAGAAIELGGLPPLTVEVGEDEDGELGEVLVFVVAKDGLP